MPILGSSWTADAEMGSLAILEEGIWRPGWHTWPIIRLPWAFPAVAKPLNFSKRSPWRGASGGMMAFPGLLICW